MDIQYIIIPIRTDCDTSTLLDIAYELIPQIVDTIESYGDGAEGDDGEGGADDLSPCATSNPVAVGYYHKPVPGLLDGGDGETFPAEEGECIVREAVNRLAGRPRPAWLRNRLVWRMLGN